MGRNYLKELSFVVLIIWLIMTLLAIPVSAEDSVEIGGKMYCLEEGDLLFYKKDLSKISFGHVGIYSGNGNVIDAYPRGADDPGDSDVDEWGFEEKGNYFDTNKFLGVRRVQTSQENRVNAVDWARKKIGCGFEKLNRGGAPTEPGKDDVWYCSELVHCAYKSQEITLGSKKPSFPYKGYIPPVRPAASSILHDNDVEPVSSKSPSPGSVHSTDSDGSTKKCFTTTEMVYANGTDFCKNTNYNIYVCSHPVRNGDSLSDYTYSSSVNTDSNGNFTPQPKSLRAFAEEGKYAIIVDENGDEKYNPGIDAIDRSVAVIFCGDNAHLLDCTCKCDEGYHNCDRDWSNGCECFGVCCPDESPNAGTCYTPGINEYGCCNYSGGCYEGNSDPEMCKECYGGEWNPGWWCKKGECVPEASTLVVVAVGLLFLTGYVRLLKRKKK